MPENLEETSRTCDVAPQNSRLSRALDITCALVGLFLLSPVLVLIAVALRLQDGGPVFFRQARVGRDFRLFKLYKFRSMVVGADQRSLLTAPSDSRVTRVGRVLRRYKLDELPQLLNVLKGDMQLVGARPEVERYVSMFRLQYSTILQQRPGITDPASVVYRREEQMLCATRMEEQYVQEILPAKLRLSLAYQQRRTLISDIVVLFETVMRLSE